MDGRSKFAGVSVFGEADELSETISIIDHEKIVATCTPQELKNKCHAELFRDPSTGRDMTSLQDLQLMSGLVEPLAETGPCPYTSGQHE